MKRGDAIVIAVVVAAAVAAFPLAAQARAGDGGVAVRGPKGITRLPSSANRTVVVEGAQGSLTVEIAGGRARVLKADCPDQVCVRSGWSAAGRPVVCAPNRVVVESGAEDGAKGGALDAVSR